MTLSDGSQDPSAVNGRVDDVTLERDEDEFYVCPLCGAPSLYIADIVKHIRDIHQIQKVRGIKNEEAFSKLRRR